MGDYIVLAPLMGVVALLFAYLLTRRIMKNPVGNDRMKEIADAIHDGAMAFLSREYRSLLIFRRDFIYITGMENRYELGNKLSIRCCLFNFGRIYRDEIATQANVRGKCGQEGQNKALGIAFSGGAVMGMSVVGLGLLGLGILYFLSVTK